jgi:hypothetical protein
MAADSFVYIGKTHRVCQDHAAAGATPGGLAYAVVSDGCSSSDDTDFGSWALVRAAQVHLSQQGRLDGVEGILSLAARMAGECWVDRNALDATLLLAVLQGSRVEVRAWGDGVVLARRRDGRLEAHRIEYRHGAPAYPSYLLDPERGAAYLAQTERGLRSVAVHLGNRGAWETRTVEAESAPGEPLVLAFDAAEYDLVGVASDGLSSFQQKLAGGAGLAPVPLLDVVPQIMAFKGAMAGEFVVRRMRRFLKDGSGLGWQHDDDIAVAMLHLPECEGGPA